MVKAEEFAVAALAKLLASTVKGHTYQTVSLKSPPMATRSLIEALSDCTISENRTRSSCVAPAA